MGEYAKEATSDDLTYFHEIEALRLAIHCKQLVGTILKDHDEGHKYGTNLRLKPSLSK